MKKLWIDPQLPFELEELFLTYGIPSFAARGDTISRMDERCDDFYYIADGLAASLCKTSDTSGSFLSKILPESRAFGFTYFPHVSHYFFELRALRDSAIYSLPYLTIRNMLANGQINQRQFRRYEQVSRQRECDAANMLIAVYSKERITAAANAFNLAGITYDMYGTHKPIKLDELDIKELVLMKAAHPDRFCDKPLHSRVTSTKRATNTYYTANKTYS